MKGQIRPNHIPMNKYRFLVAGLLTLTPTEVSGIEEELQTAEMPDRTRVSGGNTGPSEVTIKIPMHHAAEMAAMESWYKECQDPVTPTYKKPCVMQYLNIGPGLGSSYQLLGTFPTKRGTPQMEMANEGELATVEWTLSVDQILKV